jgi:hypothetical protein
MLAGKPDAGNPHVRFDEGEQRNWRKPPVALYSTGFYCELQVHPLDANMGFHNQLIVRM